MENTSTSKAEGIDGAPRLWALPLLKVRIVNKLQVSASASSLDGDYPPTGEVPDLVGHPEGEAVTYSELLSASVFMFYLLFMSLTLTQKTVNSSKEEKRVVQFCIVQQR